jgi:hypothetical protein
MTILERAVRGTTSSTHGQNIETRPKAVNLGILMSFSREIWAELG